MLGMAKEREQGRFIVFEGGEGAGKSLQAKILGEALAEMGYGVVLAREPGGGPLAGRIREILLTTDCCDSRVELCLFLASRRENLVRIVIPALSEGKIVVADRYEGSTLAYQGYGGGLPVEEVKRFNEFITGGLKPDLTILIDIDIGESRKRLGGKGTPLTVFDARELEFHRKVREGYLELAQAEDNWVVIDGSGSIEEIHQKVLEVLAQRKILP